MLKKCVLQGKKYSLVLLAVFFCYLTFKATYIKLPSSFSPVMLYSNNTGVDLKQLHLLAISKAKQSILLHTFSLSDQEIIKILNKRAESGVEITVLIHKKNALSLKKKLSKKIQIELIQKKGLFHEKILLIDRESIYLGSANMTTPSLMMHDNSVIGIHSKTLGKYLANNSKMKKENGRLGDPKGFSFSLSKNSKKTYDPNYVSRKDLARFFFLPDAKDSALMHILESIHQAKKSIHLAMFTFTHPDITDALVSAFQRGVILNLFIDKHSVNNRWVKKMKNAGITISTHSGIQLLHHKWLLVDKKKLLIGSANYTKSAFKKNNDYILTMELTEKKEIDFFLKISKRL